MTSDMAVSIHGDSDPRDSIYGRRVRPSDVLLTGIIYGCAGLSILLLAGILGYAFVRGLPALPLQKSAAHGIVFARGKLLALAQQLNDQHVTERGLDGALLKDHVRILERNPGRAKHHGAGVVRLYKKIVQKFGLAFIGLLPKQARRHGAVSAVPLARGREAAVQMHLDGVRLGKLLLRQLGAQMDKIIARRHGRNGVRTGGARADLEHLEHGHINGIGAHGARLPQGVKACPRE